MRIGIVTFWNTKDNYGQVLQCYALQNYLKSIGHSTYLIRYELSDIPFGFRLFRNLKFSKIIKFLENRFRMVVSDNSKVKICKLDRGFDEFREKHLNPTEQVYNIETLRKMPPDADMYICGSDQVWNNLYWHQNTSGWFLNFGGEKVRRVAYAASVGGRVVDKYDRSYLKKALSGFTAVGVRENYLKKICDSVGITSKVVLDPTLLLPAKEYVELLTSESVTSEGEYMFLYVINITTTDELYWYNIESYLELSKLDYKVVYASGYESAREILPNKAGLLATVPEWLSYLYNAKCVITTSFHGVVFCIKMKKPFLAILLSNKHSGGNIRTMDLLKNLSLESRIYNGALNVDVQMEEYIDWHDVDRKLDILIQESKDFLNDIL